MGFALVEGGVHRDPGAVLSTALSALEEAKGRTDGVIGLTVGERSAEDEPIQGSIEGFVESLVGALEAKDPDIEWHLRAVSHLALLIGRRIPLSQDQIHALSFGGLLHDVGKIGIPDTILHKPGRLTAEEYQIIKRHPVLGARMLSSVRELAPAVPVVRHHHERFDGKGYPEGLAGEDIPLGARIVLVVDAYHAMRSDRPYRRAMSESAARTELLRHAGTQFDPRVVDALLARLERDPEALKA